jgi:hypothetical protein
MATMTVQQYIDYYANLLPAEYRSLPNAFATIETLAALGLLTMGGDVVVDPASGDPVFDMGELVVDGPYTGILPLALAQAFNIQTAVGQQLQFLGETIGAVNSGLNLSGQFVTLSDSDYRLLLQAVSARNFLRATNAAIDTFLQKFFPGIITVQDMGFMHMSVQYKASLGSKLWAELFITQGFLPRPLGVAASAVVIASGPFFGLRRYLSGPQATVRPICTYTAPVASPAPLLKYTSALAVP